MYQMKEQDKTPEKKLNEVEIGNLPEKEFRIIIVKMIQDLGKKWRQRSRRCKKCYQRPRRIKEQTPRRIKEQTNRDEQYNN